MSLLLRAASDWLRRAPVEDPLDRRNAPFMQVLFLFIGCAIPLIKLYYFYLVFFKGVHARYGGYALVVDSVTDVLMTTSAWLGFYLVRRGRFRLALSLFLGVFLSSMAVSYAALGLTRLPVDDPIALLILALAGQVLGRRALWLVYVALLSCLLLGAFTDALLRGYDAHFSVLLGSLVSRAIIYLLIVILLDQTVAALRATLAESNARGDAVQRLNTSLQHEMSERERAQHQLVHAQKMEAVGRVSSGVAHDFDNVLNVVLGYAMRRERLADRGTPALLEAMEGVELAARRALAISRKLLNFSRQDVQRPEVFDAGQVVRDIQPMLRQMFDADTRLPWQTAPEPLLIFFDRAEFELMLLNIAANARDAMPEGGCFNVDARRVDNELQLLLRDSGSGMPEAVRHRIFEPFYTTKPMGRGTGLGLSVVHDLVMAAGGRIEVESASGQGTEFRIHLPLADAAITAGRRTGSRSHAT